MHNSIKHTLAIVTVGTLLACSNATEQAAIEKAATEQVAADKAALAELDQMARAAATAHGTYLHDMQTWTVGLSKEEIMKQLAPGPDNWYEKNIKRSGITYFDGLHQFGLAHLDSTAGLEAFVLAISIANGARRSSSRVPYEKLRAIQELLYENFLNQPEYTVVLKNIKFGQGVGYPESIIDRKAWAASSATRYAHEDKLLERAVQNVTHPIVKNHAMLFLAQHLVTSLVTLDKTDTKEIAKRTARAEVLLQAVMKNTKANKMEYFSAQKVRVLKQYTSILREISSRPTNAEEAKAAKEAEQNKPKPQAEPPMFLYDLAEKLFFEISSLSVGKFLPVVTVPDLDGNPQTFDQYRGRVLLVDFWATWCGPCIAKFPHLRELKHQYAGRPFEIVGISSDTTTKEVTEFLEDNDLPWDLWFTGPDKGLIEDWSIGSIPLVFLLDHTGKIIAKNPSDAELDAHLASLVDAAENAAK